ncbi:MAG: hypothetical protein H0V86_00635 [Chloroflexia bacterium]|nr:hypothetical protein [Chloroflexia bacterium]
MRSLFGSRHWGVVVGLVLLLVASMVLPRGVAACSGGPPGGARGTLKLSEVAVVGQVTNVEFLEENGNHAESARVTIRVDHNLKGDVPNVVSYVDRASYIGWAAGVEHTAENAMYGGGGGACGTLDFNPEGKYVLALFSRHDNGTLSTSRTYIQFVDEPEQLTAALERYGLPVQLPAAGAGGMVSVRGETSPIPLSLPVLALAVAAVGALRFWRT